MKNRTYSIASATLIAVAVLFTQGARAQNPENLFRRSAAIASNEGGVHGGGGDTATEGRIQEIRRDLVKWISEGGAKRIDFSKSRSKITYVEYLNGNNTKGLVGMNDILLDGAVVINAIRDHEQRMDDEEMNTYVSGYPKTCKGFISKKDSRPHMLCNSDRFWNRKPGQTKEELEADQYRQVHHEYAALGLLEKNIASDSDYSISDQITGFLRLETVLRLAVKSGRSDPTSMGEIPVGSELTLLSDLTIPANSKVIPIGFVRSDVYDLFTSDCVIELKEARPETRLLKAGRVFRVNSLSRDYKVQYDVYVAPKNDYTGGGQAYDKGITLVFDSSTIAGISCVGHRTGSNNWSLLPSVTDFEKIALGKFNLKLSGPVITE